MMMEDGGGTTIYRGDSSRKFRIYLMKLVGIPGPMHLYEMVVAAPSAEDAKRVLPRGITPDEAPRYGLGPTFNWEVTVIGDATSNVVLSQVLIFKQNVVQSPPPRKTHPIKPAQPKLRLVRDCGGVSIAV